MNLAETAIGIWGAATKRNDLDILFIIRNVIIEKNFIEPISPVLRNR